MDSPALSTRVLRRGVVVVFKLPLEVAKYRAGEADAGAAEVCFFAARRQTVAARYMRNGQRISNRKPRMLW